MWRVRARRVRGRRGGGTNRRMTAGMTDIFTARLRLRRAAPDDLDAVHALLSDPAGMRYWSTPPHDDIEQTRVWLAAMIERSAENGCDFIVEHEGRVIGKAGCFEPPEVGFIFRREVWGRGLASEALAAVIARAFEIGACDVLKADVDPRNAASLKLLARHGFRETGRAERTLLVGGEWCDSIYLELGRAAASLG